MSLSYKSDKHSFEGIAKKVTVKILVIAYILFCEFEKDYFSRFQ